MFVFIGIIAAILVACDIAWSLLMPRRSWPMPHRGTGWPPFPPPRGDRPKSQPRPPAGRVPLMALVCVAVAIAMLPAVGRAADVVAVPTSTDSQVWFGNMLTAVLTACAAPIAAILCAVLWRLAALVGVKVSADSQIKLTEEARVALTQAIVSASPMIAAKGWDHVDVHNKVIADAANFFLQRYPDRAAALAAQAGTSAAAAVTQSLLARLPDAMSQAAASPATPPVDPPKPAPQAIIEPTAMGAAV